MSNSLFDPAFQAVYGNPGKTFASPADWRDCPIYFLMVDRFNNTQNPPVHAPFDDPAFGQYQGGTFEGIQARLQYIKDLGAGAVWLSPVLENPPWDEGCYHGYGIHSFLHANPRFATNPATADDELRALVDAAHQAGLYVIFDIVLNHTGDIFSYDGSGSQAPFSNNVLPIHYRDGAGAVQNTWTSLQGIANPSSNALVWPKELQRDEFFRRQGAAPGGSTVGDFDSLKQMLTENRSVQDFLIRAYQYVIARFDIDGFRIDTLPYLKAGLPLLFGNAIREYALSIGKKNFFTYGEVLFGDIEDTIAAFIGRNTTTSTGDQVGIDAALDYPLYFALGPVVQGGAAPTSVIELYLNRKAVEEDIISSHGDATRFFVTFLDNHDMKKRLRRWDPAQQPALDDEVTLGIACLASLPGIPCIYYGTEQGLHGAGTTDPSVREALWGGPGFNAGASFYFDIAKILALRAIEPALRYGRFYFRQLSGDGTNFGFSTFAPGVLAWSRILNDREILVVANTSKVDPQQLHVVVDSTLTPDGTALAVLYSNKIQAQTPSASVSIPGASVTQVDNSVSQGTCATLVRLRPGEVQIIG